MAASGSAAPTLVAAESKSPGDRLLAWSCRIAAILAFGAAIGWVLQAPLDVLLRDLSSDDSYYYLQIAREFGQHGSTSLDGRNATNGYHPLWLLLLTLIQLVWHDPVVALRAAKALEFGLVLAATGMAWRAMKCVPHALVVAPLWLLLAMRSNALYEGLETAVLYAALTGSAWALRAFLDQPTRRRSLALGVALTCAGLARLEAFGFGFALLLFAGLELRVRRQPLRPVLLPAIVLLVALAAYLAVNRILFGTLMPISGLVKQWWSLQWNREGAFASLADLFGNGMVREGVLFGVPLLALYLACLRTARAAALRPLLAFFAGLALLHAMRWLWFGSTTRPPFSFYTHYFVTGRWLRYGAMLLGGALLLHWQSSWFERRRAACRLLAAAVLVACLTAGVAHVQPWLRRSAAGDVDWEILSQRGITAAAPLLPAGARVGSFDSGVVSWFAPCPVTNLDGLVNSTAYFARLRAGDVEGYLQEQGIEYIANAVPVEVEDVAQWFCARTFQKQMAGRLETIYRSELRGRDPEFTLDFRLLRYVPPGR